MRSLKEPPLKIFAQSFDDVRARIWRHVGAEDFLHLCTVQYSLKIMGSNVLRLIILLVSVRDAIAVPRLVERQGEGLLWDDLLLKAGAAAAGFASGAKVPEALNNLKEFVMPSPEPDQTAAPATAPVEANPPANGQDLDSIPETAPGQALPGETPPDTTVTTDRPVDIELSVEEAPYVPPTKGDECIATSQSADTDPTVGSQSLLSVGVTDIESCSNQEIPTLAMTPRVRSFIHLIASALR